MGYLPGIDTSSAHLSDIFSKVKCVFIRIKNYTEKVSRQDYCVKKLYIHNLILFSLDWNWNIAGKFMGTILITVIFT